MSLKVLLSVPYGNAAQVAIRDHPELPEVWFTPDPHGEARALWFCFKVLAEEGPPAPRPERFKLVLRGIEGLDGAPAPGDVMPVYRPQDQGWFRTRGGIPEPQPDGQTHAGWVLPYPAPAMDVAFCFPYGKPELQILMDKSRGSWRADGIGLSHAARPVTRLSNDYGATGGTRPGLYLVARERAGETPTSWVLDGLLQFLSRSKRNPYLVWSVPFADPDGMARGDYVRAVSAGGDVCTGWGDARSCRESRLMAADITRWAGRCNPGLVLELRGVPSGETTGVFSTSVPEGAGAEPARSGQKWRNVIRQELGDLASPDFVRAANAGNEGLSGWVTAHGWSALTLFVPYGRIGSTILTQKLFREIGERVGAGLLQRNA